MAQFEPVVVRKLKFDGSVKSEWDADLAGTAGDEWLVTVYDSERHAIRDEIAREPGPRFFVVHYLNTVRPLTIQVGIDGGGRWAGEAKCDAALPAGRSGATIDWVDLDLDVIVFPDFTHYVRDQDVFAERSVSMGYSEEAKRAAHLGILHALRIVRGRQFPFDGHAEALIAGILGGTPPPK